MAGRTWRELAYDRTYSIRFDCIDDVLVAGALSSAVWIITWAFTGGAGAVPDVDAIVNGLVDLVRGLPTDEEPQDSESPATQEGDWYSDPYADTSDNDYNESDRYQKYSDEQSDEYYEDEDGLDRGPRMSRKII